MRLLGGCCRARQIRKPSGNCLGNLLCKETIVNLRCDQTTKRKRTGACEEKSDQFHERKHKSALCRYDDAHEQHSEKSKIQHQAQTVHLFSEN